MRTNAGTIDYVRFLPFVGILTCALGVAGCGTMSVPPDNVSSSASYPVRSTNQGLTIAQGMRMIGFFPPLALELVYVGEETGRLDNILHRLSNYFDEEMTRGLDTISKLIEPFVLFILGGVVGFILLAAFLPIYQLAASF